MCGIAGALDLTGTREFSVDAAPGDDRGDRPPRARRRAGPHRAGRRAGRPAALDRRPGRRPAADRQRGRVDVWVAFNGELFEYPELRQELLARGPPPGDPLRHRGVGPPLRGPRRGDVREGPGPVRRLALGPQRPDPDPRPRPGRDLPALLRRARRLAALGLGGQGAAGLGAGRGPARPEGDRPPLHVLLRRDDADVLRGGQVAPAGPLTCGSRTAGSSCSSTGTSTSPTPAHERRLDDPTPLVDELEGLLRQAVERRLRGDVPVVSYISGGLDSTVVLGPEQPAAGRGGPVVHDRARPGGARRAVAVDRGGAGARLAADDGDDGPGRRSPTAFPELIAAAEGPVLDTSCAALMRLAAGGPRAGVQGRPDRRGGRRGAGRLRLVQDAEGPRRDHRPARPRACRG